MKQETAPRYEVVDELGRDPATQIHHCRLRGIEGFEKDVVIKRIAPQRRADGALVRLFLDEARLVAKVSHPSIAQVFEVGHGAEGPYLVMEYVKGVELAQVAARARHAPHIPYGQLARLIAGICDAVSYAEAVLHQCDDNRGFGVDLELANIVVSREGGAKLLDFGLLRRASLAGGHLEVPDHVHVIGRMLFDLTTARREGIDPDVTAVVPSDMVGDYPRELERIVLSTLHARKPDRPTLPEIRDLLEGFATLPRYRSNASALTGWLRDLFPELVPPSRPNPLGGHETTAITVAGAPQGENARRERTPTTAIHRMGRRRRAGVVVTLGATALVVAGGAVLFHFAGGSVTPPAAELEATKPAEASAGALPLTRPTEARPEEPAAADDGAKSPDKTAPADSPALASEPSAAGAAGGKGSARPRSPTRASSSEEPRTRRRARVHATGMDFDEDPWPNRPTGAARSAEATDPGDGAAQERARGQTAGRAPSAARASESADRGALTPARLAAAPAPAAPRVQSTPTAPPAPRPRATVPIPTLPRIHIADDPEQLARACRAVENAVVTVAGVNPTFARGSTDRLCRSVPAHAPIYPIAMYYFLVREAALEHDSNAASANLEAAHASGVIVRYKDLPGIEPSR